MLAALRSCGEKRLFVNVSRINYRRGRIHTWQWNLQPRRYCAGRKCADYFKYSVVFLHSKRYFFALFRCSCQQSPLVQSTRRALVRSVESSTLHHSGNKKSSIIFVQFFENVSYQESIKTQDLAIITHCDRFDRPSALKLTAAVY